MQNWEKQGLVFSTKNYAAVPIGNFIQENVLRIYYSSRQKDNKSTPFFIEYDLESRRIIAEQAIEIPLGNIGTFDEHGIMPTSLIKKNNEVWIFYIGWNTASSVPFRNSIGLAISRDDGVTFEKYSDGPILDRSLHDKCFVASNCVLEDDGFYKMYYLSCDKWEYINGKLTHFYNIKYAYSKDAVNWIRDGHVCINFSYPNEYAISVPRVLKENGIYKMWYSYRGNNKIKTYRIGYAESLNGKIWERKDQEINLSPSDEGWDSEMICYPFIFDYRDSKFMLYNGNEYGKTGFGLAKLK
jgi:hypothetical protein